MLWLSDPLKGLPGKEMTTKVFFSKEHNLSRCIKTIKGALLGEDPIGDNGFVAGFLKFAPLC
jgi:hypothetical protein